MDQHSEMLFAIAGLSSTESLPAELRSVTIVELCRHVLDQGADPEWVLPIGKTALDVAVATGTVEVVRLLLDRGADVRGGQARSKFRKLARAATAAATGVLQRALVDAGNSAEDSASLRRKLAKPDCDTQFTPLVAASYAGRADVAELLLDRGADTEQGCKTTTRTYDTSSRTHRKLQVSRRRRTGCTP